VRGIRSDRHWHRTCFAVPAEWKPKPLKWWQREDAHLFVVSFGAFFTVFYTFIA
jgi:hypothetical protein